MVEVDHLKVIIGIIPGTPEQSLPEKLGKLPKLAFLYLEGLGARHSDILQLYAKSSTACSSVYDILQLNIISFTPLDNGYCSLLRCAKILRW